MISPKKAPARGALIRRRNALNRRLNDVNELLEQLPERLKPGPAKQWDDYWLMILWVLVQAHVRAFDLRPAAACRVLVKSERFSGPTGRLGAIGRLQSRYYEGVKSLEADPESFREADGDADAMAKLLRASEIKAK
jgi:hypothetical protein